MTNQEIQVKQKIEKLLAKVIKDSYGIDQNIELTQPDVEFGDYACNVAMKLSKQLGKSPKEIAEEIVHKLKDSDISEVSIAGPGFINIKLSDKALYSQAVSEPSKSLSGKEVVAEYSDPNPFKVLHAGHLYTSIMGDVVSNLLENAGANVHRVNFGGDVGLHVGKTMWAIIKNLGGEKPEELDKIEGDKPDWISKRYVEGENAYTEDEESKKEIIECNKRVYEVHNSVDFKSDFAKIYWTCREWSYQGFDSLYERLEMKKFEKYYPESMTTPLGLKNVKDGLEKRIFAKSDGAVVYEGESEGLHTRVFLTREGLPTYEAKDLGLALWKWEDFKFDLSVMITGNEIVEYMKVVQAALSKINKTIVDRTVHLTHGHIKLQGGVKMSSRKGTALKAGDVLDAAKQANIELSGKNDDNVVIGPVRYAFLKQRMGGDIVYDPKESVSLEGNSGPYLQYAHARARSILRKVEKSTLSNVDMQDFNPSERLLVRKLSEYSEVIELATKELMPHHIASYLYELAQEFNRFYEHNRVIGDERQDLRLKLVELYADILKKGLILLGINAPEEM